MRDEYRRDQRRQTFLKTAVEAGSEQASGHLLNVSAGGALVHRDPPPTLQA